MKTVQALTAPAAGNRICYDDEIPGFCARITSNGVVSFVLEYRINGRHRCYTIGRHSDLTVFATRERAIQRTSGWKFGEQNYHPLANG